MATETAKKEAAAVMLTINDRDKAVSLGTLALGKWDADKAISVAGALLDCLDAPLSYVRHNPTYAVESE